MEKAIKLVMHADKSIKIFVNEEEKYQIEAQNRSISADKLYDIFDFSIGDYYTVSSESITHIDSQVLEFFTELLKDIAKKANAIEFKSEDLGVADVE